MSQLCAACNSSEVTTGLGEHVSCLSCGAHQERAHVGDPSLHGDSNPPLAVEDTAGEFTVEATPEGDDE